MWDDDKSIIYRHHYNKNKKYYRIKYNKNNIKKNQIVKSDRYMSAFQLIIDISFIKNINKNKKKKIELILKSFANALLQ